jgi:hypothetical protein
VVTVTRFLQNSLDESRGSVEIEAILMRVRPPKLDYRSSTKSVHPKIISVYELLADDALVIPEYQRPYKWSTDNVNQLITDILDHQDNSAYRLGTIVLHQDGARRNIVDGQQRTISLLLLVRLLHATHRDGIRRPGLRRQLDALDKSMINPRFPSAISHLNIRNNYQEISRIILHPEFSEKTIDFILNRCEVVRFILSDISEAFQFFDSQNSRGRDLNPHDLLKAYHLREFAGHEAGRKQAAVADWEACEDNDLRELFAVYLYRIRNWCRGRSARNFGKNDIGVFKGVNLNAPERYPHVEMLRIAHDHTDSRAHAEFPFHLDQIIINGRRFFQFASHYGKRVTEFTRPIEQRSNWCAGQSLSDHACAIIKTIDSYPSRRRTGDRYVRILFDCLLLYYADKFGAVEISRAIETLFVWTYSLRLEQETVQLASMDNYAIGPNNLFQRIRDALHPIEVINVKLSSVARVKSRKADEIQYLFKKMGYLEPSEQYD